MHGLEGMKHMASSLVPRFMIPSWRIRPLRFQQNLRKKWFAGWRERKVFSLGFRQVAMLMRHSRLPRH